jgi:membrane protease YdiL (CAAX protease family)
MLGILVILIASWILLFAIEKKNILSLGLLPNLKRSKQFLSGILITGLICAASKYFEAFLASSNWVLNPNISTSLILNALWWDFKSVLTEELIFRGAVLFILLKKLGIKKGILISAIFFGVYHWFSQGVLGNIVGMILLFIGTGLMGYVWALAFAKTESIMLPLGLHLGWNMVNNTLFSKGPLGELVLISTNGNELEDWISVINFMTPLIIAPILILLYLNLFVETENIEFKNMTNQP